MSKVIHGVTHAFAETGTEGFHWAVQDEKFILGPTNWQYEGLNCLKNGDHLEIYDSAGEVLFSDTVNLEYSPGFFPYPVAGKEFKAHCHDRQKDVDIRNWSQFFLNGYKCKLVKK